MECFELTVIKKVEYISMDVVNFRAVLNVKCPEKVSCCLVNYQLRSGNSPSHGLTELHLASSKPPVETQRRKCKYL